MAINSNKPENWKEDIKKSVDMYNGWFMEFAPKAFRETRVQTTKDVEETLIATNNLMEIGVNILRSYPQVLPTLRMATCPPLAVDRLIGLSGVSPSLVKTMENKKKLPPRSADKILDIELGKIGEIIEKMADPDIFVWLETKKSPTNEEIHRAATIVADRLCGSVANPIVRNAQEKRQLLAIEKWLVKHGYKRLLTNEGKFDSMPAGTFSFRMNVPVSLANSRSVNIPVDAVIMPKVATKNSLPVFFEAKSAGDFANVNKRRKEEAAKMAQLKSTYGSEVQFNLFLCGYFDTGYLGYEAAEGIDWVWEHRIDDLSKFGL